MFIRVAYSIGLIALLVAGCRTLPPPIVKEPTVFTAPSAVAASPTQIPLPTQTPRPVPLTTDIIKNCRAKQQSSDYDAAVLCFQQLIERVEGQVEIDDMVQELLVAHSGQLGSKLKEFPTDLNMLRFINEALQKSLQIVPERLPGHQGLVEMQTEVQALADAIEGNEHLRTLREGQASLDVIQKQEEQLRPVVEQALSVGAKLGITNIERLRYEPLLAEAQRFENAGDSQQAQVRCAQARDLWPQDTPQFQAASACVERLTPSPTPVPRFVGSIFDRPEPGQAPCSGLFDSSIWGIVVDGNRAVRGAEIRVVSEDGRNTFPTSTNERGEFKFDKGLGCTTWIVYLISVPGVRGSNLAQVRVRGLTGDYYSAAGVQFQR